ncbi:P-loop NTPase [Halorubellus sp. PRR65]|uniref:MinD/ParA family ATP-binding protein n=1 Tax=Halorubellus sp. PRR65 TaxID=3098148 RepID=UPI002B25E3DA|nr:P-loop NTPase [Halorubellus sp. PRR65]
MLAIAGGKGGTGKTTTALALARELAAQDAGSTETQSVTVVDADVDMPDVHAMAGVGRTPTVLERPRGRPVPSLAGVRVAPAPPPDAADAFERVLVDLAADADTRRGAPTAVVDAPCGAGPDAALPLAVADRVVLVTRPTPAAVRDTAKTAAMARTLGTPVAAAVVVGDRPLRSLAEALRVDDVVSVPLVDEDPLRSRPHQASVRRLRAVIGPWQTPF